MPHSHTYTYHTEISTQSQKRHEHTQLLQSNRVSSWVSPYIGHHVHNKSPFEIECATFEIANLYIVICPAPHLTASWHFGHRIFCEFNSSLRWHWDSGSTNIWLGAFTLSFGLFINLKIRRSHKTRKPNLSSLVGRIRRHCVANIYVYVRRLINCAIQCGFIRMQI